MAAHVQVETTWLHMCEWRLRGCTCASGGYVAAYVSGGYMTLYV